MWSVKFMEIAGIKRYDILLAGDAEIPADNEDKTKYNGVKATPRIHNKIVYN